MKTCTCEKPTRLLGGLCAKCRRLIEEEAEQSFQAIGDVAARVVEKVVDRGCKQ